MVARKLTNKYESKLATEFCQVALSLSATAFLLQLKPIMMDFIVLVLRPVVYVKEIWEDLIGTACSTSGK